MRLFFVVFVLFFMVSTGISQAVERSVSRGNIPTGDLGQIKSVSPKDNIDVNTIDNGKPEYLQTSKSIISQCTDKNGNVDTAQLADIINTKYFNDHTLVAGITYLLASNNSGAYDNKSKAVLMHNDSLAASFVAGLNVSDSVIEMATLILKDQLSKFNPDAANKGIDILQNGRKPEYLQTSQSFISQCTGRDGNVDTAQLADVINTQYFNDHTLVAGITFLLASNNSAAYDNKSKAVRIHNEPPATSFAAGLKVSGSVIQMATLILKEQLSKFNADAANKAIDILQKRVADQRF